MKQCCGNCGWNCCEAVGGRFKFYCMDDFCIEVLLIILALLFLCWFITILL